MATLWRAEQDPTALQARGPVGGTGAKGAGAGPEGATVRCVPSPPLVHLSALLYCCPTAACPADRRVLDWLKEFAEERDLQWKQDAVGNIVIYRPGSAGGEKAAPVIVQGTTLGPHGGRDLPCIPPLPPSHSALPPPPPRPRSCGHGL